MRSKNYQLQFITHYNHRYNYVDSARIALEGGCRWVQLRMKHAEDRVLEDCALEVQAMCREYGATFIIDDNVALAKRIGADGVHLGKGDMPICEARKILGDEYIIGGTVNSFDDILCAMEHSAPDYFGCGPYRYTSTKQNLAPILGINGYNEIIHQMRVRGIDIPLVAIGGIGREDIPHILECGVHGIALSGSVLNADDPICEMQRIVKMFDRE